MNGVYGVSTGGEVRFLPAGAGDVPGEEEGGRAADGGDDGVVDADTVWRGRVSGCAIGGDEEREQDRGVLFEEPLC